MLKACARGDGGDVVVLHVEQVVGCAHHVEGDKGERREKGRQPVEDSMTTCLRRWKEMREKRGIGRDTQHLWCPQQGDEGSHLARQEEGGQHPKDDCITTSCLQRRQKRNGKYNDEKQHLGQLGSHSKAMALVIKCGWHDIWSHLRKSS